MGDIIKSVVECDSWYGIVALAILFIGLSVLGLIAYKIIQLALPYIYKIVCKICNTVKKYKGVHAKIEVNDVSVETDLNR